MSEDNRRITTAPNGELIYVGHTPRTLESNPAERATSGVIMTGVGGHNQCPKCGLQCTSGAALQIHLTTDHRDVSAMVELEDGTAVPLDMMSKQVAERDTTISTLKAENVVLTSTLKDLSDRLETLEKRPKPRAKKAK